MSRAHDPKDREVEQPDDPWILWQNDAENQEATSKQTSRYTNPEAVFSLTLLAGDTYTGVDAMWQFPPIDNPLEARLGATASNMIHAPAITTYLMQAETACQSHRFAMTSNGYMGLVPASSEVGDAIYLFSGFSVPFVLRDLLNGHYALVGDTYMHEIMEDQFWREKDLKWPEDWASVMLC